MDASPVVYFDGVCNLCSGTVQFILKHDRKKQLRFASLQGETGQRMLLEHNLTDKQVNSFILEENNTIYTHSTGALRVFRWMGSPWSLLYAFIIVPAFLRNAAYDLIARNRYTWFGRRKDCWMPRPAWVNRFLP